MKVSFITWKWAARIFAAFGYALFMLYTFCSDAQAHDVPASNVLLDVGTYTVKAEVQLPLDELREAIGLPTDVSAAQVVSRYHTRVSKYIYAHIDVEGPKGEHYEKHVALLAANHIRDGEWVIAHVDFRAPSHVSTRVFTLDYDAIVADIVTHNVLISVRHDFRNALFGNIFGGDNTVLVGLLHYQQKQLIIDGSGGSWMQGFNKVFRLGMEHIAEGTDHVLFLFALLLSAPLVASNHRWRQVVGVKESTWKVVKTVSGFTLGHSVTLMLGAASVVKFPSAVIEVLIALSILVSAVHAIRPLFANAEHYIAALFGLVHGMAFASSLTDFNYDTPALILAVLGFNLGIETMQLMIVSLVLPSLLLMRVLPLYRYFRVIVAAMAGMLAISWAIERAFAVKNPLAFVSDTLTAHGGLAIAFLAFIAIALRTVEIVRWWRTPFAAGRRARLNLPDPFNP